MPLINVWFGPFQNLYIKFSKLFISSANKIHTAVHTVHKCKKTKKRKSTNNKTSLVLQILLAG